LLIEDWLPIAELGIESRRESEVASALPPIRFLHVWWARRPLVASAGTILGSLLPAWSEQLASGIGDPRIETEERYRTWFNYLCGIAGDPVTAKAAILRAKADGRKVVEKDIYGYERAYTNSPTPSDLRLLHQILDHTWGRLPEVIDPTAGGGSIPYTSARYGLPSHANDLNAVAAAVLRAGVEATAHHGTSLTPKLEKWGQVLVDRCEARLAQFFELEDTSERVVSYIFARTVICPRTEKPTPLSPNWWLSKKKGSEAAVRVVTERSGSVLDECEFELVEGGEAHASDPDSGTVAGGEGLSVWDRLPIDGDYIKAEARAGRMGSQLYAVAVRRPSGGGRSKWVRGFRAPSKADVDSLTRAEVAIDECRASWLANGVLPSDAIPDGNKTSEPIRYGLNRWIDLFSPRQQLVHGVFVEEWMRLWPELEDALGDEVARTVAALLGLMQGKALNYNSRFSVWHPSRGTIANTFDTHSFAIKWTHGEFDGGHELWPWCLSQLVDAYDGISKLYNLSSDRRVLPDGAIIDPGRIADLEHPVPGPVDVTRQNAAALPFDTGTQTLVCIDPPYHDNVMYAELSDFFGVWEQHTIGKVWSDLVPGGLADVSNEAVANVARFKDFGRRKKELANADYLAKMQAIFGESFRILRDDGVMTVMFTHKKAEAWDTLGTSLMEAGFEIATSWPVNTEPEKSLHQAKKNSAASTIMLVCRKRAEQAAGERFFEDLLPDVKTAARDAVERFEKDGIAGVDLLLSTYGPVLSVISGAWPVYSSEVDESGKARLLRPEEALDVAREELIQARRRALVGRQVTFDPVTDFWLISWELFQAEEFPYDEARRLALAVGGQDPEGLASAGILKKKSGSVVLQKPADRRRRVLRPVQYGEIQGLPLVDVLHGVMVIAEVDGLGAGKAAMDRLGLTEDARFVALVQGAVNALPFGKKKGQFIRPEAETLHGLVTAYLPSVELPEEEPPTELFPE